MKPYQHHAGALYRRAGRRDGNRTASLVIACLPLLACGVDPRHVSPCEPNATRCSEDGLLETCTAAARWGEPTPCPFVCSGNACAGECRPGARDCLGGSTPRHCDIGGTWQGEATCPAICVAGACALACTPGARACSGADSLVCTAEGTFETRDTCEHICDEATGRCSGECQPNELRCTDATLEICGADGRWGPLTRCPYVCAPAGDRAECSGACTPGDMRCSSGGTQVSTCNASGQWGDATDCTDDACRAVLAGCNECEPPQISCDGQCVDAAGDPDNCGRCGHGCLGALCTAGVCDSVTLAEGAFRGLASAPPWLYVLESGISRLSSEGGSREMISSDDLDDMAADATRLYGARRVGVDTAELWSLPNTGGFLSVDGLALGEGPPSALVRVNSSSVMSLRLVGGGSTGNDCELTRFDKLGVAAPSRRLFRSDSPDDLDAEPGTCHGLSIDDVAAYTIVRPSLGEPTSQIWSVPILTGDATLLWSAASGELLRDVALSGGRVVFASSIRVGAVSTGDGRATTLAFGSAYRALAENDVAYYFSAIDDADDCASGSLLYAVSSSDAAPILLAREPRPGCVEALASDADALYWLTTSSDPQDAIVQLDKAAKP